MCIETHPGLFSFLDTIIVLFQSRPRNLPRTTLFRDILNPCSVNGDIMDSRLQRRILNILLHHGVADEIRCPLGPGIEFDAHQGCRNIILKTIIARSGSINQPLLIYRSMREKKKKKKCIPRRCMGERDIPPLLRVKMHFRLERFQRRVRWLGRFALIVQPGSILIL